MIRPELSQQQRLDEVLLSHPIVRSYELRRSGVQAATISRAVENGKLKRVSRGLYQRIDADIDASQALAEVAKHMPNGVICMLTALAFHGLTDQMTRQVWIAIGAKDWAPKPGYPPIRLVRFREPYLHQEIEHHRISGADVPIYSIPKTLADVFRNSKLVDRSVAIESLKAALDQRKGTPSQIAEAAKAGGAWKIMHPYLEALTSNG